jgi:hypothetical protein
MPLGGLGLTGNPCMFLAGTLLTYSLYTVCKKRNLLFWIFMADSSGTDWDVNAVREDSVGCVVGRASSY